MEKLLRATHQGILRIGEKELTCAVLEDGTRVLSRNAIFRALGRTKRGRALEETREPNMPSFIDAKNINQLIDNELRSGLKGLRYITKNGRVVNGYIAQILPSICDVYLEAREKGILKPQQLPLAAASEILVRALSKVGIIALVDEATGYQEVRDKKELQIILDKYLLKDYAKWAKRFPDEFYELMFRLRGWQWKGMQVNRPSVVGKYTNDLVYERLAPGLLDELKRINPPNEVGRRKSKHQQWLTEEIGHPALQRHLAMLIGFERASSNWGMFYRMVQRALPKLNEQIPLPFEE